MFSLRHHMLALLFLVLCLGVLHSVSVSTLTIWGQSTVARTKVMYEKMGESRAAAVARGVQTKEADEIAFPDERSRIKSVEAASAPEPQRVAEEWPTMPRWAASTTALGPGQVPVLGQTSTVEQESALTLIADHVKPVSEHQQHTQLKEEGVERQTAPNPVGPKRPWSKATKSKCETHQQQQQQPSKQSWKAQAPPLEKKRKTSRAAAAKKEKRRVATTKAVQANIATSRAARNRLAQKKAAKMLVVQEKAAQLAAAATEGTVEVEVMEAEKEHQQAGQQKEKKERKHRDYWRHEDNFRKEISEFWTKLGVTSDKVREMGLTSVGWGFRHAVQSLPCSILFVTFFVSTSDLTVLVLGAACTHEERP